MTHERSLRVFVYRNLHRGGWSVRSVRTGLVIAHADSVQVRDAVFKVGEAGRRRVVRTGVRTVHAGVEGTLVIDPAGIWRPRRTRVVSYNPFRGPAFTDGEGREVREAAVVWLKDGKAHVPVGRPARRRHKPRGVCPWY
jgi:hypothetical protein